MEGACGGRFPKRTLGCYNMDDFGPRNYGKSADSYFVQLYSSNLNGNCMSDDILISNNHYGWDKRRQADK